MSLATNLATGEAAIAYVAQWNIVSSNKISHRLKSAGGAEAAVGSTLGTRNNNYGAAGAGVGTVRAITAGHWQRHMTTAAGYGAITRAVIAQKAGNCHELAIVAATQMRTSGAATVHVMYFTAPDYDHVWACIGLDPGWQANNMRSWGAEAVWVDPWQGDNGVCFSISDFMAGKVRNLNSIYKCDSIARVEAGVAVAVQLP